MNSVKLKYMLKEGSKSRNLNYHKVRISCSNLMHLPFFTVKPSPQGPSHTESARRIHRETIANEKSGVGQIHLQPKLLSILILTFLLFCSLSSTAESKDFSFGGFISVGYLDSTHYNYLANTDGGTTEFVEAGINFSWTPAKRTTVNGQAFAFELGPYGNYKPLIDYLFLDYNRSELLGIQLGRVKREFGIYNHIQDIDLARTSILLPHTIYDPRFRDFSASLDGVSIYGTFKLPGKQRLSYTVYGGYVNLQEDGGLAGESLTFLSRVTVDNKMESMDSDENIGGQIWYYPNITGLRIGYAHTKYFGVESVTRSAFPEDFPNPAFAGQPLIFKAYDSTFSYDLVSLEYYRGNWNFAAEYRNSKTNLNVDQQIGNFPPTLDRRKGNTNAWYATASRRFGPFEIAYCHTELEKVKTAELPEINKYQIDRQVSLRFDATENWILKLEIHAMEGTRRLHNEYNQNPVLDREHWTLLAAKSTFSF